MSDKTRSRRPYAARVPIETRREQLLDAALQIVDRDGYDRVSIDAIAREAGVTRPVVYGAFEGLGALLGALLDRQQARALTQLYDVLAPDGSTLSPEDLAEQVVPALHAMVLADPMTWRAILTSGSLAPAVMQQRIEGDRERVRETIAAMATQALPPEVDADLLSHAILAMLEHFGRMILADPERFSADRFSSALSALWREE